MVWMCTTHGSSLMHGNWKQLSSFQIKWFVWIFIPISFCPCLHNDLLFIPLQDGCGFTQNSHIYGLMVLTLEVGHTYVKEWGWGW